MGELRQEQLLKPTLKKWQKRRCGTGGKTSPNSSLVLVHVCVCVCGHMYICDGW